MAASTCIQLPTHHKLEDKKSTSRGAGYTAMNTIVPLRALILDNDQRLVVLGRVKGCLKHCQSYCLCISALLSNPFRTDEITLSKCWWIRSKGLK
jgi:hypothetical protein